MDKDDLTHQLSAPQRVPRVALSLFSVVSCLLSLSASLSLSLVSFLLLLLSLSYSCSFSPTFSFSMVGGDDVFIHCNSCVGLRGCNRLTRCQMTRNTSERCMASNCTVTSSGVGGGGGWSGVEWTWPFHSRSRNSCMEHVQLTPRTSVGGTHEIVFSGRLGLCFFFLRTELRLQGLTRASDSCL